MFLLAILALSAITQGLSAYKTVQAQNAAAEYNARVLDRNAKIADMQAEDAAQRGRLEEQQQRLRIKKLVGEQRSAFASSGVVVDQGSPLDAIVSTVEEGELDALTIRHNAAVEQWGYNEEATNLRSQSTLLRLSKKNAGAAGATSLLTSAGSLAAVYGGIK